MKKYVTLLLLSLVWFACKKNDPPEEPGNLHVKVLNDHLNFPWEILWGPDNHIWFTEREGRVKRMDPQTGEVTLVAAISEVATTTNFNGLLGMALHPQFSSNPYVYLVYNYFGAKGRYLEKIVRYTYDGNTLTAPLVLVDGIVGRIGGEFIHNGSRLLIGPDMKLYATTGDANMRYELPQNPLSLNGKVLRINLDGSIPADNPFHNAVWTLGHRNSQGLVFAMGKLYNSEHGETTNDEINIIEKGRNYGWPFVEGVCNQPSEQAFCALANVMEPIYTWTPTVAPSGMDYYDKDHIPQWNRSLLVTYLKDMKLRQLKLNEHGTAITSVHEFFVNKYGRLRDVAISPGGKVYLCTDNGENKDMILEITNGD